MNIKMFYPSFVSDWNHGITHFLRGISKQLLKLGHTVEVFEPVSGPSLTQLIAGRHEASIKGFHTHYPELMGTFYDPDSFDPEEVLSDADLAIVHVDNDPHVIRTIGRYRACSDHFKLLFHDTHHRCHSQPSEMRWFDLKFYDGVLASSDNVRHAYMSNGWSRNVWTWLEAADTDIFRPLYSHHKEDLVWIGNWRRENSFDDLSEFFIEPVRELNLKASVYGVGYPVDMINILRKAGIRYGGYLPNYKVPELFAFNRATIQVPSKLSAAAGIPTIKPFEAMACGIPLLTAHWNGDHLFEAGKDFAMVSSKDELKRELIRILTDQNHGAELAGNARNTILKKHTCVHRAKELMRICKSINLPVVNVAIMHE